MSPFPIGFCFHIFFISDIVRFTFQYCGEYCLWKLLVYYCGNYSFTIYTHITVGQRLDEAQQELEQKEEELRTLRRRCMEQEGQLTDSSRQREEQEEVSFTLLLVSLCVWVDGWVGVLLRSSSSFHWGCNYGKKKSRLF